jgi:toxin ParE1/3/4
VKVRRTKRANDDLIAIWRHIALDNANAATAQLSELERKFRLLPFFPRIGRKREDIRKGLRMFSCDAYVILYREVAGSVEIVRVVHGARDLRKVYRGKS